MAASVFFNRWYPVGHWQFPNGGGATYTSRDKALECGGNCLEVAVEFVLANENWKDFEAASVLESRYGKDCIHVYQPNGVGVAPGIYVKKNATEKLMPEGLFHAVS